MSPMIILDDDENEDMNSRLDKNNEEGYVSQLLDAIGVSSMDVS